MINGKKRKATKELTKILSGVEERLFGLISAYTLLKAIEDATRVPSSGAEAAKNVEILNKYRHVFAPLKQALGSFVLLELMKLVEVPRGRGDKTASLPWMCQYAKKHGGEIQKESKLTQENIAKVRELIGGKGAQKSLERLKRYRNKKVAHSDLKSQAPALLYSEVGSLIERIIEATNVFCQGLKGYVTLYGPLQENVRRTLKCIMECLR